MSRIGKKPVTIPNGVTVEVTQTRVTAKGPKGELYVDIPNVVSVKQEDNTLVVELKDDTKSSRQKWGLIRSLLANIVTGVNKEFEKKLELEGVGYKYNIGNGKITFNLGYSHPIDLSLPQGIVAEDDKEKKGVLVIRGIDKKVVGHFASKIRGLRPVEPYKGKGFRYQGEYVMRKAGKTAAK